MKLFKIRDSKGKINYIRALSKMDAVRKFKDNKTRDGLYLFRGSYDEFWKIYNEIEKEVDNLNRKNDYVSLSFHEKEDFRISKSETQYSVIFKAGCPSSNWDFNESKQITKEWNETIKLWEQIVKKYSLKNA